MPDKESPFWPLARQAVTATFFMVAVTYWYKGGVVPSKDIPALLTVLIGVFGFDIFKHFTTKE